MISKFPVFFTIFLFFAVSAVRAQETTIYTEANVAYKRGMDFYDKGVYSPAMQEFTYAINKIRPAAEPEARLLRAQAELYLAKSAVRSGQPNGEQLMLDYIRNYYPDPLAAQGALEMGDFYFNQNKPDKALEFYQSVPTGSLSGDVADELNFKIGYSLFTQKKLPQAKTLFSQVKEKTGSKYYNEANYYYGMCAFFDNNLDEAAKSFQRVQNSKQYAAVVPYNIIQIYAAKKDYSSVINYGLRAIENPKARNIPQINQLIGQAYFEKKDYKYAESYLKTGADGNNFMREEDFYQLGLAQHRNQHYADAAANLENLNRSDNAVGQNAMYLLGDCYLHLGDRNKAKQAFASASRMNFDAGAKEEASWNYAKLCYELKQTQEASDALQAIHTNSKYYNEAQGLLGETLLQTHDFDEAIKVMNNSTQKSPALRVSYQKANVFKGMELYKTGDLNGAKSYFERSLLDAPDINSRGEAEYWLGDIANQQKDYATSTRHLMAFNNIAKSSTTLPSESSVYSANYLLGYDYLKEKDYKTALTYFKNTVTGIRANYDYISSDVVKTQILGDATLRLGDSYFKSNQYDEALRYYDESIQNKYSGFVYALYQKGIIQGLKGNNVEKLITLEKLANNYSTSEYAPFALLETGSTYLNINQLDKAQQSLTQLITNYKNKPDLVVQALLKLGLIAQNKGNPDQAASYYKQVFYNNPSSTDAKSALDRLQDIYVNDLGRPDEYFAFLQTIPGYKADNVTQDSITYRSAEAQYEQANYPKAITGFTNYLSRFPNSPNTVMAYYYRAESFAAQKDYSNALNDYDAASQRGPSKFYEKALEKGAIIAYNSKQDFVKSFDLYSKLDKAATTDDKRFEAELGAMRSAYRLNKPDQVAVYASKVAGNTLATSEQISTANFYLGKIAFDKNSLDEAQSDLQIAISKSTNKDEQYYEALYLEAALEYKKRNLDAALAKADKASQNNPYDNWTARCVILQADIYAEKNDLFSARAALESVISGVKGFPDIVAEAKQKLANLEAKEKVKSRLTKDKPSTSNSLDMEKNDGNN